MSLQERRRRARAWPAANAGDTEVEGTPAVAKAFMARMHDAGYAKRAKADEVLLGPPRTHRTRLAGLPEL